MFTNLHFPLHISQSEITIQGQNYHNDKKEAGARLLPAPKLIPADPTILRWKWDHKNPFRWNAYLSFDGGITYIFDDFVYGTARQYSPDGGTSLYYIVGVDQFGNEVTKHSNSVKADDIVRDHK